VLCFNTRYINNDTIAEAEPVALDVKAAVEYARTVPGITKVILLGHSGGSPLMSFYQAVAENGISYCQGPNKIVQCGNALAGMKPADGLLFAEAHPGDGVQSLRGINPSLSIVDGKVKVDPSLDPFDPKNGYNPNGASKFSKEFRDRYYAAQSRVMNEQLAKAQALAERIKKGEHVYPDSDLILIPFSKQEGARAPRPARSERGETMSTRRPQKLLKNDGTIVTQIVKSIEPPHPDMAKANRTFEDGVKVQTLQSYLSINSVKVDQFDRRHRSLLDQQLDRLRGAAHQRCRR
jgi:hypothetical protein